MSSSENASSVRAPSGAALPHAMPPPENPSAPSALSAYGDRAFDPSRSPFYATCPKCNQKGLFTPETLHRWCSADEGAMFFSEPAKHLVRAESLDPYGRDDDLAKATHVIFASSCPNPVCQSPLFLKVAGRKEEFAKIVRRRLGRPKGQGEEDLRLAELKLIDTLPKATEPVEWRWVCNLELGQDLCDSLNRLAPKAIAKRDPMDVATTCRGVLDELLLKLEAKREIMLEIAFLERKARWGLFGFLLEWGRASDSVKTVEPVRKAYQSARGKSGGVFDVNLWLDQSDFLNSNSDIHREIVKSLRARTQRVRPSDLPAISVRLRRLYQVSLLDRSFWRWADAIEKEAKTAGADFFSRERFKELAAFVRLVADDGFEQPGEILSTRQMRQESSAKNGSRIPTQLGGAA